MDTAFILGGTYLALSVVILASKQVTWLHGFLHYGKVKLDRMQNVSEDARPLRHLALRLVSTLCDLTVPKKWFAHFYYVYGALLMAVALYRAHNLLLGYRYALIWSLLTLQAFRRIYECRHVTKWNSASRMHVTHYLAGLYFYIAMPVTCAMGLTASSTEMPAWPLSFLVITFFAAFSWDQHRNHVHLASLRKYSTPYAGLFRHVSSPHYLDEIGIYTCITFLACAHGIQCVADGVLVCSMLFVCVNLAVSSIETNQYYRRRFPAYKVKWALIPKLL